MDFVRERKILNLVCSCFNEFEIFFKLDGEKDFGFPEPEIK